MEPVSFTDLPKPFLQQLINTIDTGAKALLRSCSIDLLCLVDELSGSLFCYVTEVERVPISKRLYLLSRLSAGITTLLLPEVKLVPDVTFPSGAFSRLERLVVNYRLYKLCHCLATAAGPSLHTVSIVPGRRKGSHWQAKLTKMLQVLQQVQSLRSLHLNLHCTQATAALIGQLPQLQSLQLSVVKAPGDSTPHPEHLFDQRLWNLATEPLTALTALSLNLPVFLNHLTAEQLHWPSTLQALQLRMQHSDAAESDAPGGSGFGVTGLAAAQLLLHHMPALPQLTRLVVQAHSPNDWFAGPELQLSRQAADSLGQLLQLRSLHLLVGHWQLSLRQLQPLSSCVHLTELVLSELVMGFSDEGLDDQMGSRLTREEAAAVAAGVAAAAAAAGARQQQQAGCSLPGSPGSGSGGGGGSSSTAAAGTVMMVGGHSVQVPLLPHLESLRCTTLWWRLPLVVLAPCLRDVAYKRLRNLGYGSFVLPDLQDWEEEQLPPVFGGLLQGGDAAAAGQQQPLGGLLGAILAPQGGFHPHNQQHNNNNNVDNNDNDMHNNDVIDAEPAAMDEVLANPPNVLELQQDLEMHLAAATEEEPLDAAQQQQQQQFLQDMHDFAAGHAAAHGAAVAAQQQQQLLHGYDDAAAAIYVAHLDAQLAAAQDDAAAVQAAMHDLQQQEELAVQQEQQQALLLWHQQQQHHHHHQQQQQLHHHQQQQQQGEADGAGVWEQLMHWDVDLGGVLAQPMLQLETAAEHAAAGNAAFVGDQAAPPWPHQQQLQPLPAAAAVPEAPAGDQAAPPWPHQLQLQPPPAASAATAGAALATPVLLDAPVSRAYGDALRGQRCLDCLDVCVTALCKIMHSSSSPLAHLKCLKLHMLGEVRLAPWGVPTLPQLTALEFYLPDERNWDADYNDYEDIVLWQNQHSVRSITIRGTFHAGGFFAPGHLQLARCSMPLVQQLLFVNCGDLQTDRLQQAIESKLSPLVIVEACGSSSSNSRAAAAGAGAGNAPASNAAAAAAVPAAAFVDTAGFDDDLDDDLLGHAEQHGDLQPAQDLTDIQHASGSSSNTASTESSPSSSSAAAAAVSIDGDVSSELSVAPQLISKALVARMAVSAAARGIELKWVDAPAHWRAWLQ